MPTKNFKALLVALSLYVLISPLSTYNTLAMFGLVESKYVIPQMILTGIMIMFAIVASQPLSHHCRTNEGIAHPKKRLWFFGFYVIGPPVLGAYYYFKFRPEQNSLRISTEVSA
ncbi:MAG: hypothetical protein ABI444_00655 [Candidatus Kapaibacterium sp.]|jgi:hypothetical protein